MFAIDRLILVAGLLLLIGIASSKFSARFGLPVLVLFLALGMAAGSEGIGGIAFEDYQLAHGVGTLALAIILFDGGLSTRLSAICMAWKPAFVLATAGVLITSAITGLAAAWIMNMPLLHGMLLGSIVGSTDAAAVFAVLRSGGVSLPVRLAATLEIESGSNDPMAIFLTVGFIEVILGRMPLGLGLLSLFAMQMLLGVALGLAGGFAVVGLVNRINLDAAGLYPVLVGACGLLIYGMTALLGGSGFLAIYLAGIVIGNQRMVFQRGIFLFHDAGAWLAQIVMFVVLGLLSFPSRLLDAAGTGLLLAAVLFFVARPLAVIVSLLPFRFSWREVLFLSWVGLKGAVPITLATFPLLFGIAGAATLFDVVFFVVLVSALIQGTSLASVAQRLGLRAPAQPPSPVTLELSSLRHVDGDIVDYAVAKDSQVAGRLVRELALPEGVVIALIARDQKIIPPQGNTQLLPEDHVILVLQPGARPLVNAIFARRGTLREELPSLFEFPLRPTTRVGELEEFYGIAMDAPTEATLDEVMRSRLGKEGTQVGSVVRFGPIALYVRGLTADGGITRVGMIIVPDGSAPAKQTR